ncbi:MAG TPA: GAP family protein [Mycobacterium sp.]|nr:GAP family protein [Mycobacterium sp.]
MWTTVLVLALMAATEPQRIGITALLVALPRPMRNLLVYWLGLMTSGFGVALVALFLLRDSMLSVVRAVTSALENPVVPPIQVAVGVLALSTAAMLAVRSSVRQAVPAEVPAGGPATMVLQPEKPAMMSRLGMPGLLERGPVWMSYLAGLGTSTPPVEYGGAIAVILAAGAAAGTQVSAALTFLLVAFASAEVPLVAYLGPVMN